MKGDWFTSFKGYQNIEFGQEDYDGWREMVEKDLDLYLKHLPAGSALLECCCGLGCTAVPLSHYYRITAFDRDGRILEYARKNAEKFGGSIKIVKADFRRIDEIFGPDSFDACSSGGVLEHYTVEEVRQLLDKQLFVAPIVFISVPLGDGVKTTDEHGITRYNYTEKQWLGKILKGYKIIEHAVSEAHPKVAGGRKFKELFMVVGRK